MCALFRINTTQFRGPALRVRAGFFFVCADSPDARTSHGVFSLLACDCENSRSVCLCVCTLCGNGQRRRRLIKCVVFCVRAHPARVIHAVGRRGDDRRVGVFGCVCGDMNEWMGVYGVCACLRVRTKTESSAKRLRGARQLRERRTLCSQQSAKQVVCVFGCVLCVNPGLGYTCSFVE